ncbi:MAG: DUF2608 domain-containing protein [Rickettsiaceae bacterium]|nr:DUF2608 domain-containing protein [Rickettsiaceae bacterium]
MKNIIWLITLYIFAATNMTTYAQITEITDFQLLKSSIKNMDLNTLVIFDVDHVLIMPTDEYSLNRNPYRRQLWQDLKLRSSEEEFKFLRSIAVSSAKWRLVDTNIMTVLSELKNKNIPTVALTSLATGKFGIIEKMEDLRIKELQSVGIDFTSLTPLHGELPINELKSMHGTPMLKAGIILTAEVDKAKTLEYILRQKNYYPKKIVFIDDQLNNLESLEKLCTKLKIKFEGFHYTAVSLMTTSSVDNQLENLRIKILEKEHRWLSYEEVASRMNNPPFITSLTKNQVIKADR